MASFGITPPEPGCSATQESANGHLLNKPLQRALSELARSDYRPNKNLVPAVLGELYKEYKHLEQLQKSTQEGVEVRQKETPPRQSVRPPNHGSARDRINVLRKNIRKEQDAWWYLVLDMNLLEQ
ncbi:hypothetical protein PC129_g3607 [Phytophthora cactorum]|nr:hypothetical protein PC111_g3943 [Phytophthora cactorum]KAG2863612.1 hypothetical protein PC113_g5296 [Phytophthora cactorum]KAG2995688.1 hypothetical protein PC118_g2876 [Phytophthora cactorum]KAG3174452.1 hypothetical protein PC128_g18058 [Phytophthora cactorum]KAG3225804.1 hypothetical protein PC129_g3607 [Phytophthora cactorum]